MKIETAVDAPCSSDLMIIARHDAIPTYGIGMAVKLATAYEAVGA